VSSPGKWAISHNVIIFKYSTTDSDIRSDLDSESPPGQHRPLQDDISFGGGPPHDDHEYKNEHHDDDFSGKFIKLFDADPR